MFCGSLVIVVVCRMKPLGSTKVRRLGKAVPPIALAQTVSPKMNALFAVAHPAENVVTLGDPAWGISSEEIREKISGDATTFAWERASL
jgi:hypothetical protein